MQWRHGVTILKKWHSLHLATLWIGTQAASLEWSPYSQTWLTAMQISAGGMSLELATWNRVSRSQFDLFLPGADFFSKLSVFSGANEFDAAIINWDVSRVGNMEQSMVFPIYLCTGYRHLPWALHSDVAQFLRIPIPNQIVFFGATAFDEGASLWDVSRVSNMKQSTFLTSLPFICYSI